MARIELTDTAIDCVVKMAEGNPGAAVAMAELLKHSKEIDPDSALGGLGNILMLDTWEIYGTDIYILWNDKCQRDVRRMIVLIRATQLGMFSRNRLREMAHDQTREVNIQGEEFAALDEAVCDMLGGFKRP